MALLVHHGITLLQDSLLVPLMALFKYSILGIHLLLLLTLFALLSNLRLLSYSIQLLLFFFLLRACLGAYAISDWLSCLSKQGLSGSSLCFSQWFLHLCFSPWNCEGSWRKHPEDSLASSRVWWCSCMYFHWWNCFIVGRDRGRYHWFGFFIYLSCFTFFSFIFPLKVHSFSLVLFSQCWKSNF